MKKIPFMIFIEPMNLGGGLYFVYSKDDEDNCNYLNLISGAYEEGPKVLPGGDLSKSYLEEECKELKDLNPETIEYLKWIFKENGYNPDVLGDLAESIDKLEDIKVSEFENMTKIKESIKIKDDGTPDYEAMTEEEKKEFFNDLYQLFKADAAVFDGAADDGEDLNDLKIDRWNESLKVSNIDVDKTLDDNKRDFLNNRKFESIKKIHTWEPGVVRESKFDRYTEEVNPIDDHSDTDKYIRNLHLGELREATDKSYLEAPEIRLMKRPKKLQESTSNFRDNDGDFPLVVQYLDEALSMPCPECGFNIYDDPDDEGNRPCSECEYVASEEEWEENCVFDSGLADIIEDEINASFEEALRKFGVDDLKYWFVSMKPGYYQGIQVYVEDSEYSIEDDMYYQSDIEDFLLDDNIKKYGIDVSAFKKYLEDVSFDSYEDYHMSTAFEDFLKEYPVEGIERIEDIFSLIDEENRGEEAKKINDFLDYLVKELGWTKIEKIATFSNGEAVYRKVEKKNKNPNRIKEARLQEGPGAGYDVEFLGIKITNVKIDEIKLDNYNCQYVEFEADIVPGEYDWSAEGYDWRVDGDSDYLDSHMFYEKANISGGKVTGTCANGYQGWADANATWTIDEFVKEIEGESYDLGVMYSAGYIHSDITSPFEMEDKYGIDKSDERSGYKNSYISTASIELEDPEMLNQIIEDTRYSDLYDEDEEEELDESSLNHHTKVYDFMSISRESLDKIEEFLNKMKDVRHFTLATSTNIDNLNKIKNQTLKDDKYPLPYYSYNELEKYLDAFEKYFRLEREILPNTETINSYLEDIKDIKHSLAEAADESRKIAFDILDESKSKDSSLKESNDAEDYAEDFEDEKDIEAPADFVDEFELDMEDMSNFDQRVNIEGDSSWLDESKSKDFSLKESNDAALDRLCDMLSAAVGDWETPSNRVHYFIRNFGKEALAACKLGNKKALEEVALKYSYLADACAPIYDAIMDYLYKQPLDESEDSKKLSNTKIEEAAEGPALGKVDVDSLIKEVEEAETTDDKLDVLFDALVPRSGKADTLAGEIVRAIVRIIYRDFNDGDIFYEGYGKETCASSAAFICEKIPELKDIFIEIVKEDPYASSYTDAIESIGSDIVDYLLENRDTFNTPNEEDSRSEYGKDYFDEWAPYYDDEDYNDDYPLDESENKEDSNLLRVKESTGSLEEEDITDWVTSTIDDWRISWEKGYDGCSQAASDILRANDWFLNNLDEFEERYGYSLDTDGEHLLSLIIEGYIDDIIYELENSGDTKFSHLRQMVIDGNVNSDDYDYGFGGDDIKTRDYLLKKEEVTALDKEERWILQDLIQKYGKPDSLYESNDTNTDEEYETLDFGGDWESLEEGNRKFRTVKVKFYTYAASYFINGDDSGLSDEDLEECDFFENLFHKEFNTDSFNCVDALDDTDFGYPELPLGNSLREHTKGHEFLRGDVCTYIFIINEE